MIGLYIQKVWWSIVSRTLELMNVCTTALLNELTGFGSECLVLEHQTQEIIARQINAAGS